MDRTLLVVLMAVASVGLGCWDLWRAKAKDLLSAVALAGCALLAGVGFELFFSGGMAVGALLGVVAGVLRIHQINGARDEELSRLLAAAPDAASRLLVLHDRVDSRRGEERGIEKAAQVGGIGLLALMGIGIMALGLLYDVWPALLVSVGLLFFPLTQLAKAITTAEEKKGIEERIDSLEDLGMAEDPRLIREYNQE